MSKLLEFDPVDAQTFFNRGLNYARAGKHLAAITDYCYAIEIDPELVMPYFNRGISLFEIKQYKEALADFDKAIALTNSEPTDLLSWRGLCYSAMGLWGEAINNFNEALKLHPGYPGVLINLAITKIEKRDYHGALHDLKRAVQIEPDQAEAYFLMGEAYEQIGKSDLAIDALSNAISIKPFKSKYHYMKGRIYTSLKDYQSATVCYTKAIETNKGELPLLDLLQQRGLAYFILDSKDEAAKDFKCCLSEDDNNVICHQYLGNIKAESGDYDDALKHYSKAIELYPNDPELYLCRAQTYQRMDKHNLAIEDFSRIIVCTPINAKIHQLRGDSFFETG